METLTSKVVFRYGTSLSVKHVPKFHSRQQKQKKQTAFRASIEGSVAESKLFMVGSAGIYHIT